MYGQYVYYVSYYCPVHTKVKVKCTLVQALRLCTDSMAHRGNRDIALLFHDHGTRSGWGVRVTPRPLFTPGKDPVPVVQEAVWAPGPVWTGAKNLAPTRVRSPDRTALSQSLYRLRYPAHNPYKAVSYFIIIILNIQGWAIWPVPSPELQLLSPSFLRSSNCSLSLWAVVKWF
jgi:hypothetical protein